MGYKYPRVCTDLTHHCDRESCIVVVEPIDDNFLSQEDWRFWQNENEELLFDSKLKLYISDTLKGATLSLKALKA